MTRLNAIRAIDRLRCLSQLSRRGRRRLLGRHADHQRRCNRVDNAARVPGGDPRRLAVVQIARRLFHVCQRSRCKVSRCQRPGGGRANISRMRQVDHGRRARRGHLDVTDMAIPVRQEHQRADYGRVRLGARRRHAHNVACAAYQADRARRIGFEAPTRRQRNDTIDRHTGALHERNVGRRGVLGVLQQDLRIRSQL